MKIQKLLIIVSAVASLVLGERHAYGDSIVVATTDNGSFGTLDLQTGGFTQTGSPGVYGDITSISGQPLYAATSSGDLVVLNPNNGSIVSTIGSLGTAIEGIGGIKMSASGTLYGYSDSALYTISTATGAATLVGMYGSSNSSTLEAIEDAANYGGTVAGNTFYLQAIDAIGNAYSNLYSVSLITGKATLIGATGDTLIGMDYVGSTLYGFTVPGQVVSLSTTTGKATVVSTIDPSETILSATLAPSVVPEPPSIVATGLGLVVAAIAIRSKGRKPRVMFA